MKYKLDATLVFVIETVIRIWYLIDCYAIGDDKVRVYVTVDYVLEQWFEVALHTECPPEKPP